MTSTRIAPHRSRLSRMLAGGALALVLGGFSSVASADEPKSAPGYEKANATKEYPAPLSQTTQPSYVPQSVALSGPKELDHQDGEPVPPGYTPVQRTRKGPIIAGAVVFGSLYSISILAAAAGADAADGPDESNELAALWVPAVGPFIQMANTDSAVAHVVLAIDGIGQSAGLAFLIYGLTTPKTVLLRNDLAVGSVTLKATPIVTGRTTGFGLAGTF